MLEKIMGVDTYVYILWGIGVLGLLLKMMANTYLKSMITASENMAVTKNKKLQTLARKCRNRQSLGMTSKNSDAYVDKNVKGMKFVGFPFAFWARTGPTLISCCMMVMASAFLYYDVSWRGSPAMVDFFANGVIVCAFLLALENIFLTSNKLDVLRANIKDYVDNLSPVKPVMAKERYVPEPRTVTAKESEEPDMVTNIKQVIRQKQLNEELAASDQTAGEDRASPDIKNDEFLESFLKEYFS